MPTEHEMKEFFQSIIDQVATLSSQAARVEGLERRINELSESMERLRADNRSLESSLSQVNDKLSNAESQLNTYQRDLDNERAVSQNLREVLISRDNKVQEVESNLETERSAHKITLSERDDARQRGDELDTQVSSFREQVHHLENDLSGWRDRAYKAEAQVADYKQQLDKINSLLNPLRVVPSADVASA